MKRRMLLPVLASLIVGLGSGLPQAQRTATLATEARPQSRPHVERLASEELEGRRAGSEGERLAAEYLASQLTRLGARPIPGQTTMFAPFQFTGGTRDGGSSITV